MLSYVISLPLHITSLQWFWLSFCWLFSSSRESPDWSLKKIMLLNEWLMFFIERSKFYTSRTLIYPSREIWLRLWLFIFFALSLFRWYTSSSIMSFMILSFPIANGSSTESLSPKSSSRSPNSSSAGIEVKLYFPWSSSSSRRSSRNSF